MQRWRQLKAQQCETKLLRIVACPGSSSDTTQGHNAGRQSLRSRPVDQFMLTARVALITGAGKGIGAAIARAFADAGAHVAIMARTKDDLEAVANDVRARGQ